MTRKTELPPWLRAMVDQRLALMSEMMDPDLVKDAGPSVVMTPLTEPGEGATQEELERWDRTCDRCGKDCTENHLFYTGNLTEDWQGIQVIFTFGVCHKCRYEGEK